MLMWKSHLLHTLPTVAVIVDNYLIDHKRTGGLEEGSPGDKEDGVIVYLIFMLSYLGYIHFSGYYSNDSFYPILARLNTEHRIGFATLNILGGLFLYYLGGLMHDYVWPYQPFWMKNKSENKEK